MFSQAVFKRRITLKATDAGANVRDVVEARARALMEGLCGEHGFVKPGTLRMLDVGMGVMNDADMGASFVFDATFKAEVCNPCPGSRFKALVRSLNRFGALCEAGYYDHDNALVPVIEIVVVRAPVRLENEVDISGLSPGDEVGIEILGRSYDLRDVRVAAYGRTVLDVAAARFDQVGAPPGQNEETVQDSAYEFGDGPMIETTGGHDDEEEEEDDDVSDSPGSSDSDD